ncbi:mannose-1-phosphate guanylyltransferase/mannose-1-phosphate guanylyltransferase / mannose-6-phosphate isomerase [Octadecabacter temperatus]|uniref:mannose-1-phosphate guanylyltransferase n=1 Tax=Octadecabacter temperatus TaxID=1458307 RepID=A0A0K0Y6W9_9RHOB|nr:mannose-1-phosphate guanylyltransferase/mannose-6-phosphate isomerase [Octadecabacter temperatus]AKS46646.1 Alginate biosynthesis protein AlgA [Octadecabacter temperatus]SIO18473.1 mannose-1-phosphate guanylyltransferase/mannose-1-phosphate guanylyltransferase / mannose-6-phosphate isomerase [Octadecabacter temperatus]
MTKHTITPVILCGGSGTRLWPLSRKSYPKQFTKLIGDSSLFQQSASRFTSTSFAAPVIVTNSDFRFTATQQLSDVGIDPGAVLIEPEARNTAPALLAAALKVADDDPDALILAAPSDHFIKDTEAFLASVERAIPCARGGQIVTFGIMPTHPETGYGYLELADETPDGCIALRRFVEKPNLQTAQDMLATDRFLWNAGIFLYKASTLVTAFSKHAPDMLETVKTSVADARHDLGFLRLDPTAWAACEDISIDFAIMEKADNLAVIEHEGDWSDLGGWDAIQKQMPVDDAGVSTHGPSLAVDCTDSLLRSESDDVQLVGLGLNNIVAIAMPDAVLVADRSRVADLGVVVKEIRARKVRQADTFPRDYRPWGYFETLTLRDRFQVKRIVVKPGAALSLQSHVHRSEHWIVVAGTARVTVGDDVRLVSENQSIYVPLGAKHRLENPGHVPMELIEVQTGSYLGEDDIVRYEDDYARE